MGRRHLDAHALRDLAVMLAVGSDCLSDLAVLRDLAEQLGLVASTPTAWRVLERVAQVATGVTGTAYNNDLDPDTATTLFVVDPSLDQIAVAQLAERLLGN